MITATNSLLTTCDEDLITSRILSLSDITRFLILTRLSKLERLIFNEISILECVMSKTGKSKQWVPEIEYEEAENGLTSNIPFITVPTDEVIGDDLNVGFCLNFKQKVVLS